MLLTLQKLKAEILGSVESYTDKVSTFEAKVDVLKKKFKRVQSDWISTQQKLER